MDIDMLGQYAFPALTLLVGSLITIRVVLYRKNRENFDIEFKEFRLVFTDFTQKLWDKEKALNRIMLDNFGSHEIAVNRFIHNIKGKRRRRFYEKWNEYQSYYSKAEGLGICIDICSEAPPDIDINKVTQLDIEAFDYMQRKHIHGILDDLIEIANKPIWR